MMAWVVWYLSVAVLLVKNVVMFDNCIDIWGGLSEILKGTPLEGPESRYAAIDEIHFHSYWVQIHTK